MVLLFTTYYMIWWPTDRINFNNNVYVYFYETECSYTPVNWVNPNRRKISDDVAADEMFEINHHSNSRVRNEIPTELQKKKTYELKMWWKTMPFKGILLRK